MPLDAQPDDGFGVVARSFEDAANHLSTPEANDALSGFHKHLVTNYLYRHAIELYLKSIIVILHRALRLTDNPTPLVNVNGKDKPIYRVHGVHTLFIEMRRILSEHEAILSTISETKWSAVPDNLEAWIETIEIADPSSDAFRYPKSRAPNTDTQKSGFKELQPDEFERRLKSDASKVFGLVIIDEDNNVSSTFAADDSPIATVGDALANAAKMLGGAQFGLMCELGGKVIPD